MKQIGALTSGVIPILHPGVRGLHATADHHHLPRFLPLHTCTHLSRAMGNFGPCVFMMRATRPVSRVHACPPTSPGQQTANTATGVRRRTITGGWRPGSVRLSAGRALRSGVVVVQGREQDPRHDEGKQDHVDNLLVHLAEPFGSERQRPRRSTASQYVLCEIHASVVPNNPACEMFDAVFPISLTGGEPYNK